MWGIHGRPVNSPHKLPVMRKMFPFDDVMMECGLAMFLFTCSDNCVLWIVPTGQATRNRYELWKQDQGVQWPLILDVFTQYLFLAATKQLYKWSFPSVCPSVRLSVCPSVRLSVRLSHLFDYVLLNVSSWNFQELLLMTKVRSMQKVKVRGQRSRSQRSQPNLTVSGL